MDNLARYIDHTLLKPGADANAIEVLATEGVSAGVAAVCVNGAWVATVRDVVAGSGVGVCSVVGFDLGAMHPAMKAAEAAQAVVDGATEIDMVVNLGLVGAQQWSELAAEIAGVVTACGDALVKVIIESAALTNDAIVEVCGVAVDAGAGFVKTSTGFHPAGGATLEAVQLMRDTVGPDVGVKASGGIRTLADARAMIDAGATRLGMSATVAVLAAEADEANSG